MGEIPSQTKQDKINAYLKPWHTFRRYFFHGAFIRISF